MAYSARITALSDEELVSEATALDAALLPPTQFEGLGEKPPISDWEKDFLAGIQRFWVRAGGITWKQRKSLRTVLQKVEDFQARREKLAKIRQEVVSR